MPSLGSFTIIRDELPFIAAHLNAWLPYMDSMVFFDGGSTDGTLEILRTYAIKNPKIILAEGKDPKDLKDDYVRLFDEAMHSLATDICIYIHPDMLPENPEALKDLPDDMISGTFNIRSFAGNPGDTLYEVKGRGERWKNIYRLRNPDLGAHYHGHYGAQNEDIYFDEITGNEHQHYGQEFDKYPYPVFHSGLVVDHYSDVRPYARRLQRMVSCLINQGHSPDVARVMAPKHPRVSLLDGQGLKFVETETPSFMEGSNG